MIVPLTFEFERSEIIAAIEQKLAKEPENETLKTMRWLMANRYHKPLAHLTFEEVLLIGGHELEGAATSEPETEDVALGGTDADD